MAREYFAAYHSLLDALEELGDAERGRLFTACLIYSQTGEAQELSGNEKYVFPIIKGQIDRDRAKYEAKCQTNQKNGAKAVVDRNNQSLANGTERSQSPPNATERLPNATQGKEKNKEKYKGNEEIRGKRARGAAFTPPTVEQIEAYCQERGNTVDPQRFFDYYKESNWKDSNGKPVLNWKQRIINWERNNTPATPTITQQRNAIRGSPQPTQPDAAELARIARIYESIDDSMQNAPATTEALN